MKNIKLKRMHIGENFPVYFIADIAANHDGDLERAKDLIYLAKEAGADAAKFQNFQAEKIVSKKGFNGLSSQLSHQKKWGKSVFEVYQDASIPKNWTSILKETCDDAGIDYFTSPYDFLSVDLVDPFVEVYKIGSGDITWLEIIEYIADKGKPVMLATGASELSDVKRAMDLLLSKGNDIVLMQCNTNYTASLENFKYINLNVLKTYSKLYPNVITGLSDHTPGHSTVLGAVAMNAKVIEKHFTDDNNRVGPDHNFSMNPKSWKEMVKRVRELENALGDGNKRIEKNELDTVKVQRRSLRFTKNLPAGHIITKDDLFPLRPIVNGFTPYEIDSLVGEKLIREVLEGEEILREDIAND